MKLPNIKIPKMILNDDLECKITINSKGTDIDGKQINVVQSKKFKCSLESCNKIAYSLNKVETIAGGIIRINGPVVPDNQDYFGGTVEIFGIKHNIIGIQPYRCGTNQNIVEYTEITIE